MSQHPEEIRQEMDETRNSLTDKISLLEQQVVQTVHEASAGVKETVAAVKDAVQETVQNVRETVGDTVDTVKESVSVTTQVKRHPWMMMAGGVGVGFAVGYVLNAPAAKPKAASTAAPRRKSGNGSHREHFVSGGDEAPRESRPAAGNLSALFENELNQLKGLAIGALAGVVRDMVVSAAPEMMRTPLTEIINDFTTKFGGQPIEGKIFGEQRQGGHEDETRKSSPSSSTSSGSTSPFHKRQTLTFPD